MFPSHTKRFEDLNLEVDDPGTPWVSLDPKRFQPIACLMYVRTSPKMAILVIGEAVGIETKLDNASVADIVQAQIRGKSPSIKFSDQHAETCGGMEGTAFHASIVEQNMYWSNWCAWRNGYSYQVIVFGEASKSTEVDKTASALRKHVRQIEPNRVAHMKGLEIVDRYESKAFGYRIDLTNLGWMRSKAVEAAVPGSDFAAVTGRGNAIAVICVPLPERTSDTEPVVEAMTAPFNLDKTGNEIIRTSPYRTGGLVGQEIECLRGAGEKHSHCLFRVVSDKRCAYLTCGSATLDTPENMAEVRRVLDRVTISEGRAPDVTNLTDSQRNRAGIVLNKLGLLYLNRGDLVASLNDLSSALKYAPSNEVVMANYLVVLAKLDRTDEALASAEKFLHDHPHSLNTRSLHAELLCKKGDFAAARKDYASLFAEGFTDEIALKNYIDVCIRDKAYDEALSAIEAVMQRRPTLLVQRWQAGLYGQKGDTAKSISMFEDLRRRYPNDVGVGDDLAGTYIKAEKYNKALAVTQQLLDEGKQDETSLLTHGRIQLQLGRTADAKKTFERAVALYPQSDVASALLKVASRQLGEGDNSSLKTPIDPVQIPTVVQDAIEKTSVRPAANCERYGAEELTRVVGISFEPNKPLRKTRFHRIKVLTSSAVTRFGTLSFKLDPLCERLYVNRLTVTNERGETVAQGAVENFYMMDDTASGLASCRKFVKIPVPGLKPGYTLEYQVTTEQLASSKLMPMEEVHLSADVPVDVSAVFVKGEIDAVKWATNHAKLQRSGDVVYGVEASPAMLRVEPKQPSAEKIVPIVWFGPQNTTWENVGHDYLASIDDKLELDKQTRATSSEITKNCPSKREKLAAIASYVQQTCSYQGIEFGRRARIPNAASKTLSLKYGDCKDHALLTKQLLEAAGIHCHLALVRSSGVVIIKMPSLDQFDHMVVFVPSSEIGEAPNSMGGLVIDTTDRYADALLSPPYELSDQPVFVLDPVKPHLIHTPKYAQDAGQMHIKRHVTLNVSGSTVDAMVDEEVTLNSYLSPGLRAYIAHFEPGDRSEAIQNLLSGAEQIRVKRLDVDNLDQASQPLVLKLQYIAPNSFHELAGAAKGKSMVGSLPSAWEKEYLRADYVESRETPFAIVMPRFVETSTQIDLPEGYRISGLDACNGSGHTKFVAWSSRAWQTGKTADVEYQGRMIPGSHPADAYQQFYSDLNESLTALNTPITLQQNAVRAVRRTMPRLTK
ncbi:MAG TPA: tetratricopeptide repeat protein [Lacipirellulaceae bacterium]|nr:tetratricopeptide repeat protein [Lacipirellulaceae bacterium]